MLKRNWALVVLVYLVLAEALSLVPVPDLSLCLIQPENGEQPTNHNDKKYCPAFHTGAALVFESVDAFLERHDKSVVGGFTIVLAISTIGLWLATNALWKAGEKQFGLLAETAVAQSRDMQASIVAAQQSATAATQALSANRAWIILDSLAMHQAAGGKIGDADFKLGVMAQANWRNRGRSPAIRAQIFTTGQLGNFLDETAPQFIPDWRAMSESTSAPIGPDQVVSGPLSYMVDADRAAIIERRAAFFVYSMVRYTDIFSPEQERISEICLRVRFNGEIVGKDGVKSMNWETTAIGPQNAAT
jgi:hypothetical protein